jgi:hypothetical protein
MVDYRRSCGGRLDIDLDISAVVTREQRPANLVVLILLDPKVHEAQTKGLADRVRGIDAKNAGELGGKVYLATCELAERLSGNSLGTAGLLWKLKTGST